MCESYPAFPLAVSARPVKIPVLSSTTSAPSLPQGNFAGSRSLRISMRLPFTTSALSSYCTVPLNRRCVLSYLSSIASVLVSVKSLIASTSNSAPRACMIRNTSRPIRPKPLIPTRIATTFLLLTQILQMKTKAKLYRWQTDPAIGQTGEQLVQHASGMRPTEADSQQRFARWNCRWTDARHEQAPRAKLLCNTHRAIGFAQINRNNLAGRLAYIPALGCQLLTKRL